MASANYDISLKVTLEDADESRRTKVKVTYKDPQTSKEHFFEEHVPAPPKPGKITEVVGKGLKLFIDRGFGLVDASKFKSQYKEEDTIPSAVEMGDAEKGKPPVVVAPKPVVGAPNDVKKDEPKKDEGKKADAPANK